MNIARVMIIGFFMGLLTPLLALAALARVAWPAVREHLWNARCIHGAMLHRAINELCGDVVVARDGRIGSVNDLYFDDREWTVRYVVVDTGEWLPRRKVLIAPQALHLEPHNQEVIWVDLTREQVEKSPGIEADAPVSHKFAEAHARYYGSPVYWQAATFGGAAIPWSTPLPEGGSARELQKAEQEARGTQVRSGREVVGYRIDAVDGALGHVEDFVVDEASWRIADMVVDTRNWLPGRKVLVPPDFIEVIDWRKRAVRVRLSRSELREARAA